MPSTMDVLRLLDLSCADCSDLVPPPDTILAIPPPPLPAFLLNAAENLSSACGSACDWVPGHPQFTEHAQFNVPEESEIWARPPAEKMATQLFYSSASRSISVLTVDPCAGAPLEESWLMILVTSSVGVFILGALLALFLLKLKQERCTKVSLQIDPGPTKGCEVLYPGAVPDSRLLWATLTPRGTTQHLTTTLTPGKSFDNSGYVDPDDFLRVRPRVSPPTRIEHPNLPPLNLHRTLRRTGSDTAPIV